LIAAAGEACCVGFTVFSGPSIGRALRASRRLRERYPALPIVWGGWHPSILPEQCVAGGVVDVAVIAQGEGAFRRLVDQIDDRESWTSIPGLCVAVQGRPARTAPRRPEPMDSFPPARYSLLDVEAYFARKGRRQLDYSSSRGCPYKCTFCADPLVYESKWTGLPAERVVDELHALHRSYRMTEVFFLDDDLFASLKRIRALAAELLRRGVIFTWKGTARADELCRLPVEFFSELRDSGCSRINIGAESGSQRVLDRICKQYQVEQILTAGERLSSAGIGASWSFIAGFPGEDQSDFDATLSVLKRVRAQRSTVEANIYFYSPYPGTALSGELEQQGLQLPRRLEDWDDFNIDASWNSGRGTAFERRVRNANFYLRHGYDTPGRSPLRRLLRGASRLRCDRNWFAFPVERVAVDAFRKLLPGTA
jgi:radical SAM superfamily enzyme YgiQ (UPF0313 family)